MYISYKLPLTVVPGTLLECGDIACTAKQKWYSGQGREVIRTASCDQDRAINTEFFNLEIAVEIMLEAWYGSLDMKRLKMTFLKPSS